MKVLVSDFDKTLFDDNYINNVKAVNDFVDKGNMFIIATGRHKPRLLKDLINIKYGYLICNDGSIIYDNALNCIYRVNIDNTIVKDIINFIKPEIGDSIFDWYVDTTECYSKDLEAHINAMLLGIKDIKKAKLLMDKILKKFDVAAYISDNFINIRPKGTSKSKGIEIIAKRENFIRSNIYTIGDTTNDLEMISDYNGYCMKVSNDEVKKICNKVVNTVEELVNKIK